MQNKKTIVLIRKLQNILPRSALMILYKVFIRAHFDCRKLCSFYKMYKNKNPVYNNDRSSRLSTIKNNDCKLLENTDTSLTQTLLYGNSSLDINTNSPILNATINFILSAKGFEEAFI